MGWNGVIRAVDGEPAALKRLAGEKWSRDAAVGAALLLLDDAPHPTAATVVVGTAARCEHGPLLAAALTPHVASDMAAWRADPDWAATYDLIRGIAHLIAAGRHDPAFLRDAVGVVVDRGQAFAIAWRLEALGADGWDCLLNDKERNALWTSALRAHPVALGFVWSALTDAQQGDALRRAAADAWSVASLIGGIGAAAWITTRAALRRGLIDAAAREPWFMHYSAPAWGGMIDTERGSLVTAVVNGGSPWGASYLLTGIGGDGRRALSPLQRAARRRCRLGRRERRGSRNRAGPLCVIRRARRRPHPRRRQRRPRAPCRPMCRRGCAHPCRTMRRRRSPALRRSGFILPTDVPCLRRRLWRRG